MIKGIGVDVALLRRFSAKDDKFIRRVLTENELFQYSCLNDLRKAEYLAGRFCAKEAYYKAAQNHHLSYQDVEVLEDKENGIVTINDAKAFVSISHDGDYVVAYVIIEK